MTRLVADIVGSTLFLCGFVACWLRRRPSRVEQAALEYAERCAERAEKAEYQLKLERMALQKSYEDGAALQLRVGDLEARLAADNADPFLLRLSGGEHGTTTAKRR